MELWGRQLRIKWLGETVRKAADRMNDAGPLKVAPASGTIPALRNSSKRPYGVGLLVAGYDEKGPHLFETCPSGNYFEYYAMATRRNR